MELLKYLSPQRGRHEGARASRRGVAEQLNVGAGHPHLAEGQGGVLWEGAQFVVLVLRVGQCLRVHSREPHCCHP